MTAKAAAKTSAQKPVRDLFSGLPEAAPRRAASKARAGKLVNFTGVDSPYDAPEAPEIRIDTMAMDPEAAADLIVRRLLDEQAF